MSLHIPTGPGSLSSRNILSLFAGMKPAVGAEKGKQIHEVAAEASVTTRTRSGALFKGNMYQQLAKLYELPEEDRAAAAAAGGEALAKAFAYIESTGDRKGAIIAGIKQHAEEGRAWDGTVRIGGDIHVIGSNAAPDQARGSVMRQAAMFEESLELKLSMYASFAFGTAEFVEAPGIAHEAQADGEPKVVKSQGITADEISARFAEHLREWLIENGVHHLEIARTSEGDMVLEYAVDRTFTSMDYTYAEHSARVQTSGRMTWDRDGDGFTLSPSMEISRHGWDMTPGMLLDLRG